MRLRLLHMSGGIFSLPLLLIMLANSWWPQAWRALNRRPADTRGKRTWGFVVQGQHLTRHILWALLFEGYASLTNPVALRLQAADILTKQTQGTTFTSEWFQGRAVNSRMTNTTVLELMCANLEQLLALGYHTEKSHKSNTVILSACIACFTCSSWSDYKEKWRRKAHYHHFTDKETVAQKGSDLSCSPVEEQGGQVKPLKSQSDALSPELL